MRHIEKATNGRKKRWIPILAGAFAALLIAGFAVYEFAVPAAALDKASRLEQSGAYEQACAAYTEAAALCEGRIDAGYLERAEAGLLSSMTAFARQKFEQADALLQEGQTAPAQTLLAEIDTMLNSSALSQSERDTLLRMSCYGAGLAAEAAGDNEAAYQYFTEASGYAGADESAARCFGRLEIARAKTLFYETGDLAGAFGTLKKLGDFEDAPATLAELTEKRAERLSALNEQYKNSIAAGAWYTAAVGMKGVLFAGDERYDVSQLPGGADAVYGGMFAALYIQDGKLTLFGDTLGFADALEAETDVASAAVGLNHALVLHGDGTVAAFGQDADGKCDVSRWTGITGVAAGAFHSAAVKKDGSVLAAGSNLFAQCDVESWQGIRKVAAGLTHTVGLRADGTVVATGDNTYGQCDVSDWRNVIDICCGANHTLALTADFTVLATGDNSCGQCDTAGWTDIIAFAAGAWHTAGLRADGLVAVCGENSNGQGGVDDWRLRDVTAYDEAVSAAKTKTGAGAEYALSGGVAGPWLYLGKTGAVQISRSTNYDFLPLVADLFAAAGSVPMGILAGGGDGPAPSEFGPRLSRQNDTVFAITGDYLTYGNNPKGIQIRCGKIYTENGKTVPFAAWPDGTLRLEDAAATTAAELLDQGVVDCWTFGPVLVEDGARADYTEHPFYGQMSWRSAIGQVCPWHFMAVNTSYRRSITLDELSGVFLDYGCTFAYNMDGGQSTSITFMGEQLNRSTAVAGQQYGARRLCDMIGFLQSDLVPEETDPYASTLLLGKS